MVTRLPPTLSKVWADVRDGSRTVWVCPLGDWQLDAGRHETDAVVDAILRDHFRAEHQGRTLAGVAAELDRKRHEDAAAIEAPYRELEAALQNVAGTLGGEWIASKLIEHHAPDFEWSPRPSCSGCDQGCSCEAASWPCSTVKIIARAWLPTSVWADVLGI